jgi:nitrate/TMAO reductase-like tetraheme cytochrome c subunit
MNSTTVLFGLIAVSAILAGLLMFRPSISASRGGKILAFLAVFVLPVLAGTGGLSQQMERSKDTAFCTSCHVMEKYGTSLRIDDPSYLPAAHFQNNRIPRDEACYTCHTHYAMFGNFKSKMRGLRHLYVQYLGTVPEKPVLYEPYNNRECLHCHSGARNFEEGATHNAEDGRLDQIKSNQLSCNTSGCHEFVHNVKELPGMKLWTPGSKPAADEDSTGSHESTSEEKK